MKILLALSAALLLGATAQAKFPAEGLVKTASSGVIQGKAVLMKADSADLHDSKLARIRSNKFIASMAKRIPEPAGKSTFSLMENILLKPGMLFPGRPALRPNMNCSAAPPLPSCGKFLLRAAPSLTEASTIWEA